MAAVLSWVRPGGECDMSDNLTRLEEVRAAGRRLDTALAIPLDWSGPIPRNGAAPGGWLKTLFGGAGQNRAEPARDRAAYLLLCQSVVAAHVIDRATTATFPRAGRAADYAVREAALPADTVRALRNTARPNAPDLRKIRETGRLRTGLVARLINHLM